MAGGFAPSGQMTVKLAGAKAGADLSAPANQYKFVKLNADRQVILCAATTDVPCGVLQEPCKNGDAADVLVIGETQVQVSGSLAAGNLIGTDASGLARQNVPGTDTTKYIVGQVTRVAGATSSGNFATALINCASPARGA